MKSIKYEGHFDLYLKIAKYLGYAQSNSKNYSLYSMMITFLAYTSFLSMLVDLCLYLEDFEHLMESARIFFPVFLTIFIDIFFRVHYLELEVLIFRSSNFAVSHTYDVKMMRMIKWIHFGETRLMPLIVVLYIVLLISRLLLRDDRPLALNAWFPFNTTRTPIYEFINMAQIASLPVHAARFVAYSGIYFTALAIACSQLEELSMDIMLIKEGINKQQKLDSCIRKHQEMLEFLQMIEGVFNMLLLSHFLLIASTLCFAAVSFVMSDGDFDHIGQAGLIATLFMITLYCYCWFGDQVKQKAEEVAEAAWECEWIGSSLSFQRSILFIIARANKEFTFTAGKFAPVSRTTMVKVLRQTLSILTFLLSLKK